jgi:hypothetical protein
LFPIRALTFLLDKNEFSINLSLKQFYYTLTWVRIYSLSEQNPEFIEYFGGFVLHVFIFTLQIKRQQFNQGGQMTSYPFKEGVI